jgi:cytochrome c5
MSRIIFVMFYVLVVFFSVNAEALEKTPVVPNLNKITSAPAMDINKAQAVDNLVNKTPMTGKNVYELACTMCHKSGIMGAPKIGDKAEWAPRIAQIRTVLTDHAIKGFVGKKGMMPAKGGNTKLTDAEVGSAVDYIVSESK